ncbi:cytochrome c oxidase assembly protein [Luteimonas terricola]|uniref:Membrane protein n=1 Tax=Luteimonas terricola TaxID=645597 RepID=A0ABQ2EIN4_9GAMM|nr:cytochrome c oxidase assembly protein [Luteimonas terricola]GGK13619.1 membrane protein [Luteimonas terricola]
MPAAALLLFAALSLLAGPVLAHAGHEHPPTLATAWTPSPWLLLPLAAWTLLYAAGLRRLWGRAGIGAGVGTKGVATAAAGVLVLLLSTTWPLDAYGEWSLAAHIAQHMLLLAFVPPMLLAGQPLVVAAHALPARMAGRLHRALGAATSRAATALTAASVAHGAVLWTWHLPVATTAALESDPVHWAMHGSFLAAGLWLWAAMWRRIRDPHVGAGAGVVAMVAVMMQMGFLGALLTFAARPLYPVHAERAPQLGLDVMADQQLAGVLMWVPSCIPYLAGAMWLLWHGFARLQRKLR